MDHTDLASAPDPQAINLQLDLGLAFGTGSHPTTRLCLRWLDSNLRGGETLLDYGCGSGILAIARSGSVPATPSASISIRRPSLPASRTPSKTTSSPNSACPTACWKQQFDVVVANILTNPLKLLAPLLAGATAPAAASRCLASCRNRPMRRWRFTASGSIWPSQSSTTAGAAFPAPEKPDTDESHHCPNCQTCFKVTDEQLKLYSGKVRCGCCAFVFNALNHLIEVEEMAAQTLQHAAQRRAPGACRKPPLPQRL